MRIDFRVKHDVETRRLAAELFADGLGRAAAAKRLSVPEAAVRKWQQIYRAFGSEVLLTMDGRQARYTYVQKVAAAWAVVEDGAPLASAYQCTGLTHSRTLLPMVDAMLKNADLTLDDINAIAIAAGPGSFTGLRIGIAAVKGLAWAADKPCLGVSTLEAMAQNAAHIDGLIVGAMDARRSQVYNAVFEAKGGELTRLTPDRAISLEELCAQLQGKQQPITVLGDGGVLCYRYLEEHGVKCSLAPSMLLYQSAVGVGLVAERAYARGEAVSAQELLPVYLRPAQAERLRSSKLNQ